MAKHACGTAEIEAVILAYGQDILTSAGMRISRTLTHHSTATVYLHSLGVTYLSILLSRRLHLDVDENDLVRGALLHDYFLYDQRDQETWHRHHWTQHPRVALCNAERDFTLDAIQEDIICKHMFPLTPVPPACRESALVCVADKLCAMLEKLSLAYLPPELAALGAAPEEVPGAAPGAEPAP